MKRILLHITLVSLGLSPVVADAPWSYVQLQAFGGTGMGGANPSAAMIEGDDGALYGTTSYGGTASGLGFGTVFKLDQDGSGYAVLHNFGRTSQDERGPYGLGKAGDGALHGTTWSGGAMAAGTVFTLLPEPRSWFRTSAPNSSSSASLNALGAADTDFRLQASTSLAPSGWWDVTTNTASEVGALSFTNLPTYHPRLFYRLVTP